MPTTDYVVEGRMDFVLSPIRRVRREEIDTSSSDFQRRRAKRAVVLGAETETSNP